MKYLINTALLIVILASQSLSQTADVKVTLSEQFFDALFEAVFTKLEAPSVSLASSMDEIGGSGVGAGNGSNEVCKQAVVLKREIDGVRTAVRFRQGKIYAPIAFLGNYSPPLIGCIEFQGWAETNIELAYDRTKNALVGNARVLNVNLSGANGIGGNFIAQMVQTAIDNRINPVEIITMDKLSFNVPVREAGNLRMEALNVRHEVRDKELDVIITYRFDKAK
ncbi:MAG: hypothetical protein DWQ47_05985 [Acidobacteria bacterium]|nr:MAG: hypothetical protein DWQ32_09535 [Acidobacteriota bacterium]REK01929.1 MAG: hypothetical protein DWQ38_05970 [Acidobacteriota bacterium]REK14885.1 MAG: hypothetical protein DWQ43_15225 [Acidobacteriota bacterium]REK45600.1 MAG: hypothetical protein DWQ47_05985 [Acidobacteriota bacterium]